MSSFRRGGGQFAVALSRLLAAHRTSLPPTCRSPTPTTGPPRSRTHGLRCAAADCVVRSPPSTTACTPDCGAGGVCTRCTVLVRLLASLHDDDGNVAVTGLHEALPHRSTVMKAGSAPNPDCWTVSAKSGCGTSGAADLGQTGHHQSSVSTPRRSARRRTP